MLPVSLDCLFLIVPSVFFNIYFQMADAMEMMILAILSPALHCEWQLDKWKQALITTVSCFSYTRSLVIWIFSFDFSE